MTTNNQKARLSDYGTTHSPPPGQKKHRLARLLGGGSSSRTSNNNVGSFTDSERPTASVLHDDSAYGSADSERKHDIIQVENDGSIPNTSRGQNLALDKGTGEVFDEDSGEVVTVVTTTTTTTTTTTSKPGNRGAPDVRKDVMTTQQEHHPVGGSTVAAAGPASAYDYNLKPAGPTRDSTYASQSTTASDYTATPYEGHNYPRASTFGSVAPTSPSSHNFSYPSRAAPVTAAELRYDEAGHVPQKKTSRLADLKAVAVGLHGVGETLRGTINSTIDERYARKDPTKAAAIREHNQAVLDRGRAEMASIPHRPRVQDQYGNTIGRTDSAASGYPSTASVYNTTGNTTSLDNPSTTGAYHASNTGYGANNPPSTTYGPHDSKLANKLDPRVDSDLDGKSGLGRSGTTGTNYTSGTTDSSVYSSGTYDNNYNSPNTARQGDSTRSSNYGPHDSNLANRLDPRVDSDLDGSKTVGSNHNNNNSTYGSGVTSRGYNNNTTTSGTDLTGTNYTGQNYSSANNTAQTDNPRSSNYGPHNSNLANRLDPRVDSDQDGSRTTGNNNINNSNDRESTDMYSGGTSGYNSRNNNSNTYSSPNTANQGDDPRSTNYGPHSSNLANKLDPRVDSDLDGSRTTGNNTSSTGYGSNSSTGYSTNNNNSSTYNSSNTSNQYDDPRSSNYGPHSSNLMNRLDPRVDSDLDGSRTAGNNSNSGTTATGYNNSNNNNNISSGTGYNTTSTGYQPGVKSTTGYSAYNNPSHNTSTYNDDSSVSNDSRDRLGYQPPRGTAVRGNSETAPQAVSGVPERGDSVLTHHGNNDTGVGSQSHPHSHSPGTQTERSYSSSASADTFDTQTRENTSANRGAGFGGRPSGEYNQNKTNLGSTTTGNTSNVGTGTGVGTGVNTNTNTANDGYTSGGEKKTSTLGKLFKRKPVGGNTDNTGTSDRKFY